MGDKIRNFADLLAWKKAHELVKEIYRITESFPKSEQFSITNQMRRCVVSIPANIAEEFERRSKKSKINFYNIAQGSLSELKYYIILSRDLGYHKIYDNLWKMAMDVSRLLSALIRSIESS